VTEPSTLRSSVRLHLAVALALALVAALLVLPAPVPAAADDGPPPGAPEPPFATERVGEFPVGKTTVLVDVPHRDADLPVEVWYPADAASAADAERGEYTLRVPFGDGEFTLRQDSPLSLEEPAVADGRFPLVVFSHGSGGVRFQSLFLGEELASHGFVVIAPDHLGNTFADGLDPDPTANPARDRPRDVSALLDAAEAGDLSPLLGDGVDTDRVAVAGHSFGGYTALAAAGGNPDVDYAPDPRVDAIVPIAPATRSTLLSDEVLAGIDVPALFIGGTADDVTPIVPNVTRPQALMASDPLYRIDVEDAGHYSFSNVCDFAAAISDQLGAAAGFVLNILPGYPESCDGTLRDIDEVLDITSLATTGFLQTELGGPDITDPTDPDPTDPDPTDPGRPLIDFPDVPVGNVHRDAILELARDGILRGGLDGRFRPDDPITRGQVAAVLARTAGLTPVTPSRFPDVAGSVHAGDIEALAAAGIIDGYADGTFRPLEPIRRDHVAALVARWLGVEPVADGPFTDIARTPHAGAINALYEIGVVNGRTASTFAPSLDIRRDQFASVVSRARPSAG
jgi:predicted dienelactone hydrolase